MKRTILSGRKKTNDLGPLNQKTKTPTLFDHTTKIQQKLFKLKQQINEKKKNHPQHPTTISSNSNINTNLNKTQTKLKPSTSSNIVSVQVDKQLSAFLKGISMENYEKVFAENGIDSLEILRQIKQKELEEIGVAKGHALKIMVLMRKMLESRQKANRKQLSSAETVQNTSKINSKYNRNNPQQTKQMKKQQPSTKNQQSQKQPHNVPLEIVTQTQHGFSPEQQLPKRRYFCLYCYQVSSTQFCKEDCEQLYNKMFEKYQKNLNKVQQLYSGKLQKIAQPTEQQYDENQFVTDLGFLDLQSQSDHSYYNPSNNLNQQTYKQALDLIKLTLTQTKQQQAWQTLTENDQNQKQLDAMIVKQQ